MEDDNMAVDVALWTILAAMAGFIARGCIVTRRPTGGRHATMRTEFRARQG
jgi:hypothetical protein